MKKLIYLYLLLFLLACVTKPVEFVEESFDNGKPKTVRYYKDDSKLEMVKEILYYENGNKRMEGSYQNNERTGKWSYWYQDGTIWSEGVYKDGVENGLKTVYHENGQKYYEGLLVDGKRTGLWNFWDKNGILIKEINYNNN
ncbi:MAG: hypothetical protein JW731_00765 [Bacteroidales bacterium]|nr:hypothetical protein [Bacteroidales bacterium]